MTLLQYERGMDGSENAGGPGSRVYCQVRAWYSGTHGRQSGFFEPVGAKLSLLPSSNSRTTGAKRKRSDGTRSRHTLRHHARGPGLYCSSGPGSGGSGGSGLVSGAVLVGRWAISGSKCEPAIDIEVRQRARARTSLAPTPVPHCSYSAPDALQSAADRARTDEGSIGQAIHDGIPRFAASRLASPHLAPPLTSRDRETEVSAESHRGVTEGILCTGVPVCRGPKSWTGDAETASNVVR
ncbi:hypothetical protein BGZ61DRAFT_487794 [Ilyonectria robusta]|uniref:uncharacterized protein n=1 Tax=Ilyonectria robusta TaxID=1079257 RepID=UPI001E8EE7B7|nr:uncharacterized protein BGZ61DRAFT_487794 [Ilyonectria robusta]KAH8650687.1 hypothetical protein BGZ61DRAFT_487794 [Ilyonectria robusta]